MRGTRCVWLAGAALVLAMGAGSGTAAAEEDPFVKFRSPITNPTNFEDPRTISDVRPIFVYHSISDDFAGNVLRGGYVDVFALQLRVAVTDRLSIIATKDGYILVRPTNPVPGVVEDSDGWGNIAFGAKYNFWRDEELNALTSLGLRYEAPSGNAQGLQGPVFLANSLGDRGNGLLNPFFSGLWGYENFHVMGYTGGRFPLSDVDSMFFDLSLHADYEMPEMTFLKPEWTVGSLSPTIELNWIQCLRGGDRIPLSDEGFDYFNLGSSKAGGNGVVTMGFGARWRFVDNLDIFGHTGGVDFGAAYELPLTSNEEVFGWRFTTDFIFWVI